MQPGDRVRCISIVESGTSSRFAIKENQEYIVKLSDNTRIRLENDKGDPVGGTYWYPKKNFVLVNAFTRVSLSLDGEVMGRSNGTVTIKLTTGEVVIVPESLAPVDPKLLKFREIFAEWVAPSGESDFKLTAWADNIRAGKGDEHIIELIAKHNL